jgi:hypothetical protein
MNRKGRGVGIESVTHIYKTESEDRAHKEEIKSALIQLYNNLGCKEKGTTLTMEDLTKAYKAKLFAFEPKSVPRAFLSQSLDDALEGAGLPKNNYKQEKAEKNFTKQEIESWVISFIKTNRRSPKIADYQKAQEMNELPSTDRILKICKESIQHIIKRFEAQRQFGNI